MGDNDATKRTFERALAALQELLDLAPNHSRLPIELAWLHTYRAGWLFDVGEAAQSKAEFGRAIEAWSKAASKWPSPSNARALSDLLTNCPVAELRNPAQAITALNPVLEASPGDSIARVVLAWANCRLQQPQEALETLRATSATDSPLASELFVRATALHTLNQPPAAQMMFDAAVAIANSTPGDEKLRRLAKETAIFLKITPPGPAR